MEIAQGRNGRWNVEGGRFAYVSREEAEEAYRHFIKFKNITDSLEAMPKWMRKIFDYRVDLAKKWLEFYAEGMVEGTPNPNIYAWIKFKKEWKRGRAKRWLPVSEGGPGSGFFGHSGRPGLVGGSSSGEGDASPRGKEKGDQKPPKYLTYFHGTTVKFLKSIAQHGLVPSSENEARRIFTRDYYQGERADSVFVSSEKDAAIKWAEAAVIKHGGNTAIIFEVRIPITKRMGFDLKGGVPFFYLPNYKIPPEDILKFTVYKMKKDSPFHFDLTSAKESKLREEEFLVFYVPVIFTDDEEEPEEDFQEGGPGSGFFGHAGRPGLVGGSSSEGGADASARVTGNFISVQSRDELPEYAKHLKIPPAWTDLRVNPDPNGNILVVGKDSKGRDQYVQHPEFKALRAAEKFERIKAMAEKVDGMEKEILDVMKNPSNPDFEEAVCSYLILKTGIRPGSEEDTGAEKQAFGATTLEARHVQLKGDYVYLIFVGKKGVPQRLRVKDETMAGILRERKAASAKERDKLFETSDNRLRDFVKKLNGKSFTPKDFRTLMGTSEALKFMSKMRPPKTMKEYKKSCREVGKKVARLLGNTYTVAMQSYISPTVWLKWQENLS